MTEHPAVPLKAWAGAIGAVDLSIGAITADERTPEQIKLLQHAISSAYNGWTNEPGRRAARRILPELADTGMSWFGFLGNLLAMEPRHADVEDLAKVAPEVWRDQARDHIEALTTGSL